METALGIFAVLASWISGTLSGLYSWLDKPTTNGLIVLSLCVACWVLNSRTEKRLNRLSRQIEKRLSALHSQAHESKLELHTLTISHQRSDALKRDLQALDEDLNELFKRWTAKNSAGSPET